MEILLFFIGIPCILPFISHLSMKKLTKKERQELDLPQNRNLLSQVQKAALGFKITATIFFLAIILLCLLNFPQKAEDRLLFTIIVTPLMFLSFYPIFLSILLGYNYLFYVTSNRNALSILTTPFIGGLLPALAFPTFFFMAIGDTQILEIALYSILLSEALILIGMTFFLFAKRKRLKIQKQQSNS